jgi:hypothetical protein
VVWYEDPLTLTALGTWVLVIGTLALMYWQNKQARELNSASSVMALRERFDSPALRKARRHLSRRLLSEKHDDVTNLEVGAYFELIGTLTHRRVLEEDLIWEAFGTWISGYYYALRHPVDVLGRTRQEMSDPLLLHEFEWLAGRMHRMDTTHGFKESSRADELEVRALLKRESELDAEPT